ncbi:branched-chain amino acid ABC transporter permease [Halorussus halophilus]|uniref:branched-chain amino acid ABC transporter permease n=1 Tax=Halorussus halophilus TaxID=2650975 RepID=UPI001300EA12|nr:branched-chain amino acid ABC transporter permease [Halorussus halophilus]
MSVVDRLRENRLPLSPEVAGLLLLGLTLLLLGVPFAVPLPNWALVFLEVSVTFLLYGLLVLGLDLQFGSTGLVNFGHVAFFAVGAYAAAMATANDPFAGIGLGYLWPVGLLAGLVAAGLLGALIGVATLRLRDDFLAIVTLAVAEIVHDLLGSFEGITGADIGILGVPQPVASLAGDSDTTLAATVLLLAGVLLLAYAGVSRLTNAPYGRVLRAIRADDRVTGALGKHVFSYKLQAFVFGAVLAGLAGALFAFYNGAVAPGFFGLNVTVLVWIGMLIGGAGNHRGVLAGLAIVLGLRLLTRFLNESFPFVTQDQFASMRLVLVGLALILIIRYRPAGIWGNPEELGVERR